MSLPKEVQCSPDYLPNIRHQGWLQKRSGSFPHSFRHRYCVIACNFLVLYLSPSDTKPHKVIWIEDAEVNDIGTWKKFEHCFKVKTDTGFGGIFSAESDEVKATWMRHLRAAPYGQLHARSRQAILFLEKCNQILNGEDEERDEDDEIKSDQSGVDKPPEERPSGAALIEALQTLKQERDELLRKNEEMEENAVVAIDPTGSDNERVSQLRRELMKSRDETKRYKKEAEQLSKRLKEAEKRIEELNEEVAASNQSAVAVARAAASSGNRAPQNEEVAAVRSQLQASQRAAANNEEKVRCLQAEVSRLKAELEASEEAKRTMEHSSLTLSNGLKSQDLSLNHDQKSSIPVNNDQKNESSSNTDPHEHEWMPFYREAQSLERNGRYADAEQQYQVVYDVKAEHHGNDSVPVASVCRDLGRVLALQEKFDQAEVQYLKAVKLCSELQGEGHPNTACALTDLAAVLREQEKLADAEYYASRAVDSLREGVGEKDVSTATALYNLAGLAKRQGKFEAAAKSYSQALEIFKEKLGTGQAETADTLYQMGCLYRKTGDYLKAGRYFGEAADAYTETYGQNDKRVAESTRRQRAMAEKMANTGPRRTRNYRRVSGNEQNKK